MTPLDSDVLAEKTMVVERHLTRVAERLPSEASGFEPSTDASDVVILHLWQATQIVIDVAVALCVELHLGTPASYADAFRRLQGGGKLGESLAGKLVRATGSLNVLVHAYEDLDMARVFDAASRGPEDLRRFLAIARDLLAEASSSP
ncbi:MAG: type VII toxin-antitoxin system HepT family RNase toxin [Gemmatimonadota bacterium]